MYPDIMPHGKRKKIDGTSWGLNSICYNKNQGKKKKKTPNSVSKIHNKPDNRILLAHKASQLQEQPHACKVRGKNSNKLNQQSQKITKSLKPVCEGN